jgi:type I restriction enzyme S subunit
MSEWRECRLGDVAEFKNGKSRPSEMVNGTIPIYGGNGILGYTDTFNYQGETVIVGRVGAYCGSVFFENKPIWVSDNALYTIPKNETDAKFLYYLLKNMGLNSQAEGSSHPLLTQTLLNSLDVFVTDSLPEQRAIARVLSSLDDKIDLLHRQNKTLEGMAEALWRKTFVEEADPRWNEKGLDEIATFLNGLPCQKYPPDASTEPLPVIKIKELRIGITDDSDLATAKVPPEYIIDDGDILFSWSGSLEIIIWSFGKGVLNQHLFKVTSDDYPKWFFYYWIKHYLAEFRDIAQDKATTMGHIQRHHLSAARVLIPDEKSFELLNAGISPVFEKMIHNLKAIRSFIHMRDTLLPKLMSGEVRVSV